MDTLGEDVFSEHQFPATGDSIANISTTNGSINANTSADSGPFCQNQHVSYKHQPSQNPLQGPLTRKQMLEINSAPAFLPWVPSTKHKDW